MHSCRIIPERGSWIEINVTKKDVLGVRIDQSGKFSAMTLLRAMDPDYSSDEAILRTFHGEEVEKVLTKDKGMRDRLVGSGTPGDPPATAVGDVIDLETGEVYLDSGGKFTNEVVDEILAGKVKEVPYLKNPKEQLILASIGDDPTKTHEEALLKIYQRLRPGNPPQLEKAKELWAVHDGLDVSTDIGSAGSGDSVSIASSSRTYPKRR